MRSRGFTLLELLVVVVIVAIAAATIVFGMFGAERRHELRTEAVRLAQLIELARDEALLRNRELGLQIVEDGYRFLFFDLRDGAWHEVETRPFQARNLEQIRLVVHIEDRQARTQLARAASDQRTQPQIVMFSSGEQTPFVIELVPPPEWQGQPWQVRSDGLSRASAAPAVAPGESA
jgi:general secretion pathway protein H